MRRRIGSVVIVAFALSLLASVAAADERSGKADPPRPGGKVEGKININEAGRAELMKLSGVGPGTADRIISYRQAHGPFRRVQDLGKVEGVGKGVLERNEGRIAVK
jgi:competence protein ComEA